MDGTSFELDGMSVMTAGGIRRETDLAGGRSPAQVECLDAVSDILDRALDGFARDASATSTCLDLSRGLQEAMDAAAPGDWAVMAEFARSHPLTAILHEDPYVGRSFRQPRGYCGDAHLMDFIYGHRDVAPEVEAATPRGRELYAVSHAAPSSAAGRERIRILAELVDETAARVPGGAEALAIASGHLRESELSAAFAGGGLARWVALDQDPLSSRKVAEIHAGSAVVEAVNGSVRDLLSGKVGGTYDTIYAAGLYDYLPRAVAIRLTRACMRMLKPGGTLLFANFAPGIPDSAFRETMMNWPLILRTAADMEDVVRTAGVPEGGRVNIREGANRNLVYAKVTAA